MKQLLICKNTAAATDLTALEDGQLAFIKYDENKNGELLSEKPTDPFGIALGRKDLTPFIISEVDVNTLKATKAEYAKGNPWSAAITITAPAKKGNYTLIVVKRGVKFNERSNYTLTFPVEEDTTATQIASKLYKQLKQLKYYSNLDITTELSGNTLTITGTVNGPSYTVVPADLAEDAVIKVTDGVPACGDKAYVKELAQVCAAGKGFNSTYADGESVLPGYPEEVDEDEYNIYSIRFATGRKSAHQVDERVWQTVHIAVPTAASAISTLVETVLDVKKVANNSGDSGSGSSTTVDVSGTTINEGNKGGFSQE